MNPQALNRYSYVLNNPLRYTDPTGYVNWKMVGVGVTLGVIAVAFTVVAAPAVAAALGAEVGFMAVAGVCDLGLLAIAPSLIGGIGGLLTVAGLLDQDDDTDPVDPDIQMPEDSTNTMTTDTISPTFEYEDDGADYYIYDYEYDYYYYDYNYGNDYYDYYDYRYDYYDDYDYYEYYDYDYYDYYYDDWWY
ncbi:hypothetical protein ACFLXK_00655 [Chloroflexota bacterium]